MSRHLIPAVAALALAAPIPATAGLIMDLGVSPAALQTAPTVRVLDSVTGMVSPTDLLIELTGPRHLAQSWRATDLQPPRGPSPAGRESSAIDRTWSSPSAEAAGVILRPGGSGADDDVRGPTSQVQDRDLARTPGAQPVPEPGTLILVASGLAGAAFRRWSRRR